MRGLVSLAIFAAVLLPAQESQSGPTQLIITYRCPPPRRAAFRQFMNELGIQRFERWKQEGVLKDYRFLFNWYIDVDTWDSMAVLSFPNYASVARWHDIEKTSPGGLPRDGVEMAWPLNTISADVVAQETSEAPPDRSKALYFVVPYDLPTPAAFRDFAATSLSAQTKALMREGLLSESSIFANRYPGGKRWQGLLILGFRDLDSFARREEVLAKIKSQLPRQVTNPERESIIADSLGRP